MPDNYITLPQLTKTTKGLVNKINTESTITNTKIGDLANLNTTAKTDLVAAINEAATSGSGTSYDDTALAGRVTALENAGYITSYTETDPIFTASAAAGISSTDISNWNAKSDFSGSYNDLTNQPTIPEDKIFPVNVTLTSLTGGTSDKTHTEILNAITNGKIPIVNTSFSDIKMIAFLTHSSSEYAIFTYINQIDNSVSIKYAEMRIVNNAVLLTNLNSAFALQANIPTNISDLNNDSGFITNDDISNFITDETDPIFTASAASGITSTDISNWNAKSDFSGSYNDLTDQPTIPNVPAWALAANKPTYTANEVGALPSTYTAPVTSVNGQTGEVNLTIPAAQVQSDWNAITGMGVILNKPTIPAATTITNTLASGTLIATINGTNIYAPAYTDADGVSY